jgi:hypothetical protein
LAVDRCAGGHLLTGQSSAPPDSLVNYNHTPPPLYLKYSLWNIMLLECQFELILGNLMSNRLDC